MSAFLPAVQNDFVSLDDHNNFQKNYNYRGLGADNIGWAWTTFHNGAYQPLSWIMFSAQYVVFGMDPAGYHVVNVVLHGLCAVLFYFVSLKLLALAMPTSAAAHPMGLRLASLLAALLFAVHPLRTEVVAWLSSQPYLCVGVFYLLSILAYLRMCDAEARGAPRLPWLGLSCLAFLASILSKGVGVGLVGVLVVLDIYPLRRLWPNRRNVQARPSSWAVLAEKIPFLLLGIASALLALKSKQEALVPDEQYGVVHRVFLAAWGAMFYLYKTVVPLDLSPWYQFERGFSILEPRFLLSLVLLLVVTSAVLVLRHRWRAGVALWAYYLIVLLPLSHLAKIGRYAAADRYTYLACMGWALLGGAGFLTAWRARSQQRISRQTFSAVGAIGALGCVTLGVLSWRQTQVWHDGLTLWTQAVHVSPNIAIPRNNLSQELVARGRFTEATRQISKAVELDPNNPTVRVNFGIALLRLGKTDQALEQFQTALRLRPGYGKAHANLGAAYLSLKRYDEAVEQLRLAIEAPRPTASARCNLAHALIRLSRFDEAIDQCKAALREDPESSLACGLWGLALLKSARSEEAETRFRHALQLKPGDGMACVNLARLFHQRKAYAEAIAVLREAVEQAREAPDLQVVVRLCRTLLTCPNASLRNPMEALRLARRANEQLRGKDLTILEALATAAAACEQFDLAERSATQGELLARQQNRLDEATRFAKLAHTYSRHRKLRR